MGPAEHMAADLPYNCREIAAITACSEPSPTVSLGSTKPGIGRAPASRKGFTVTEDVTTGRATDDPHEVRDEQAEDRLSWEDAAEPLPPAKRPSQRMVRCDGVSGID
jgi:ATP-dependent phosphoenolpyruvate carboxykinase